VKVPLLVAIAVAAWFAASMLVVGGDEGPADVTVDASAAEGEPGSEAGEILFVRNASTPFDPYLKDRANRAFIREHYTRMRGYPPFFDSSLRWAPPTHFYADLYAVYPSDRSERRLVNRHPNWILRDGAGQPLYVPFACDGSTCPAYAADPGNRAYRRYWIAHARRDLREGYRGVFIDNVNMLMRVGAGSGEEVAPIDPRTGEPMTLHDWQRYVAAFTRRIRAKLRGAEIVHNSIWFAEPRSEAVSRATRAADYVELERGFTDRGVLDDEDGSTYRSLLEHVDWIHSQGAAVMLEPYDLDAGLREFELANYFLVNEGSDMIASDFQANPDDWWPGWDTDLGAALGPRFEIEGGILRRDFENGLVLVNPPGSTEHRIAVPGSYTNLDGAPVGEVVLGSGEGAVLRGPA
jgi:hypothetical protein